MSTQRTKSQLDTLFANNSVGAITPALLRDFVETMLPSRAGLHFDVAAPTSIVTPGTFVKASGTTSVDSFNRFDMPISNRVQYTGSADITVMLVASVSITCASNNQIIGLAIAKNGTLQPMSVTTTKIATGADVQAMPLVADGMYSTNDYFEIWLTNYTSTASVTIAHLHARIVGFMA